MKNWYRILILFLVSSSLLTFTAAAQQKNTDTERARLETGCLLEGFFLHKEYDSTNRD